MDILNSVYSETLAQSEHNINYLEELLNDLNTLKLDMFSGRLTVPALIPIGNRILFRGALKHTNEVLISLGADYFTKCSIKQAELIRQHRIKDAQAKLDVFKKEKEYLEKQMFFKKETINDTAYKEIIEEYNEETDKIWRKKHRKNLKKYKLQSKKVKDKNDVNDEELWNRLEELELQEELANELALMDNKNVKPKREQLSSSLVKEQLGNIENKDTDAGSIKDTDAGSIKDTDAGSMQETRDLLMKVIRKQCELEAQIQAMKQKEKNTTKTEQDLMARIDEMEQLEELEDEMDRLDDIIPSEDTDHTNEEDTQDESTVKIKRRVSFADEDDSETIEITFKHSEMQASIVPYKPKRGIQKPSDIYEAHKNLFSEGTSSILKKSKYIPEPENILTDIQDISIQEFEPNLEEPSTSVNRSVEIKDVIERKDNNRNTIESTTTRPTSLFKKKRMRNKV